MYQIGKTENSNNLIEAQDVSETPVSEKNKQIIASLMGDAYLDENEVKVLCSRKLSSLGGRGLTSNEIMSYIYLKLYSQNGYLKTFSNRELYEYTGISPRDVYYVLESLKKVRLIDYKKKGTSCYKDIRIYHSGGPKNHTRFLSLNRTYFKKGHYEYETFKRISAGAKSALIYLLFKEKLHRNKFGKVVPTYFGNAIEVYVDDIIDITKVQRDTVILYIRKINESFNNLLNIQPALLGTLNERRLAKIDDKRLVYGAVTSPASRKTLTLIENDAFGFWRIFDMWLKSHGIKERPLPSKTKMEIDKSYCSYDERIKENRSMLFTGVISLLSENIGWQKIYGSFLSLVKPIGTFDEYVVANLLAKLSPKSNPPDIPKAQPTG